MFLAAAMAAVVTATFLPIEASARWRGGATGTWSLACQALTSAAGGYLPTGPMPAVTGRSATDQARAGGVCRTGRMARNLVACGSADRASTPARVWT